MIRGFKVSKDTMDTLAHRSNVMTKVLEETALSENTVAYRIMGSGYSVLFPEDQIQSMIVNSVVDDYGNITDLYCELINQEPSILNTATHLPEPRAWLINLTIVNPIF